MKKYIQCTTVEKGTKSGKGIRVTYWLRLKKQERVAGLRVELKERLRGLKSPQLAASVSIHLTIQHNTTNKL